MLNIFFAFILSIFIFVPYIKIGSLSIFIGYFTFFIPWILLVKKYKLQLPYEIKIILYFLIGNFFLVSFLYLFNIFFTPLPYPDLRGYKLLIAIIMIYLSTYALYKIFLEKHSLDIFLRYIYFAGMINIYIIFASYASQAFADVFYSIFLVNPKTFTYAILRYPGFLYDGASYLSVFNAFIFMIGLMIYFNKEQTSFLFKNFILINQMLIIVSMIFIGRAGFVIIGFGIILFSIYIIFTKQLSTKKNLYKSFYLVIAFFILMSIGLIIIDYLNMNWYIDWAFGFIENILNGSGSDSSVSELRQNHYFIPENLWYFLFGLSDFQTTPYTTYSADPGYTIYIHGVGLVGLLSYLFFLFYIIYFVVKNFIYETSLAFLIIFIVLSLLITNAKDFYIFYPYSHYILLFLLIFKLNSIKQERINNNL